MIMQPGVPDTITVTDNKTKKEKKIVFGNRKREIKFRNKELKRSIYSISKHLLLNILVDNCR